MKTYHFCEVTYSFVSGLCSSNSSEITYKDYENHPSGPTIPCTNSWAWHLLLPTDHDL